MSFYSETDVRPSGSKGESDQRPGSSSSNSRASLAVVALLFIGYSLISVPVPGVNEPHYLTKARAYADPTWCQNDFFLTSSNAHAVFYFLVGPVTTVSSFEAVAIVGRVLSLTLLAIGWTMAGRRLGLEFYGAGSSAAVFCLIAMSGNFSGEWIIGGFESKVPAYGFAFMSIAYWLDTRSQPRVSASLKLGVTRGLAIALHPVVGAWFCIGFATSELFLFVACRTSRPPPGDLWRHGLIAVVAAVLCALPGLIPAMKLAMAADVEADVQDSANQIQVYWRLAHHLDPSQFSAYSWIHTTVAFGLATVGLFLILRLHSRATTGGLPAIKSPWTALLTLLCAALAIAALGVWIGWHSEHFTKIENWQWRARILRYYPFRFFDALLPCTLALVVGCLLDTWLRSSRMRLLLLGVLAISVVVAASGIRRSAPAAYSSASFREWKEACKWLKENTPRDSLIMSPRESAGLKWFAERAEYVCFKDCPQDGPGIIEWNSRLGKLFTWANASYHDEIFDDKDLRRLNSQTGITHILTRRLGPFESSPVYRNSIWRVYEVPQID